MKIEQDFPAGYQFKDGLVYGSRVPGVLEIKFHNPKLRNALTGPTQETLGNLINAAQDNKEIKVIVLHGGKFYSSGNDLKALASAGG